MAQGAGTERQVDAGRKPSRYESVRAAPENSSENIPFPCRLTKQAPSRQKGQHLSPADTSGAPDFMPEAGISTSVTFPIRFRATVSVRKAFSGMIAMTKEKLRLNRPMAKRRLVTNRVPTPPRWLGGNESAQRLARMQQELDEIAEGKR
jgi:hypothetical protein